MPFHRACCILPNIQLEFCGGTPTQKRMCFLTNLELKGEKSFNAAFDRVVLEGRPAVFKTTHVMQLASKQLLVQETVADILLHVERSESNLTAEECGQI